MGLSISEELAQSYIRIMSIECDKVKGVNLSQGICDIETPREVMEGAKNAIDAGMNYYTRYDGIPELRAAISKKLKAHNGISADPETEIIASGGATGALFSAMLALVKREEEIILFEPYYGYHLHTLQAIGAKPLFVRTSPPDWKIDFEELERKITPKTRGIIINTPSNPSGKIFSKEELRAISEICARHDLIVFTDEIYEYFVYDGKKHTSPASLPELADRTVTVSGYSKTYSITGWRIGYCACKREWAERIGHINDLLYVCAPSPLQWGVAAGMEKLPDSFYRRISGEYQKKRDRMCEVLDEIGMKPFIPNGAYYVLADATSIEGKSSPEKAMNLLRSAGVAAVPGRAFYHDDAGDGLLRFCFAKKDGDLEQAYEKLFSLKGEKNGKKI